MEDEKEGKINDEMEIRSFPVELRVSPSPDPSPSGDGEGSKPLIAGTAVVYGKKSELMFDFREVVEQGFFDGALKGDIRALWNHNTDLPLGRTKNKTLQLSDTERGLDVRIIPPDTQIGRDSLESIGRGDVDQMSFSFTVKRGGDEWVKEKDGTMTRFLKRGGCERLFEVSPVTFPAYPQTSVSVRAYLHNLTQAEGGETTPLPVEGQPENAEGLEPPAADEEAKAQVRRANRKRVLDILKITTKYGGMI